ncbi:hypothetical protein ACFY4C_42335 [Actinomadura viridis]|uniref:hypothetical protein n=1 Tax=Actinomadura viridis TaxID=58110 RepID=UPI00367F4965
MGKKYKDEPLTEAQKKAVMAGIFQVARERDARDGGTRRTDFILDQMNEDKKKRK